MTAAIIITFCVLMLIAYVFDLTSSKTKIPSVILLLLLGWASRELTVWFDIKLPNFTGALPILGTIGLILIVLEGALELELNKSKIKIIKKSFYGGLIPLVVLSVILAFLFNHYGNFGLKNSFINAIPFCVISSAIAIPSVRHLASQNREFVTYESSLSDILGVLFFNFLTFNAIIDFQSIGQFILQIIIIIVISFIATIGLSYLLNKIEHHIKFIPIILMVILIYEISKIYQLPALIFILLFGLFIGNLKELKKFKWTEKFETSELQKEVHKFKELTTEAAFLIRVLFFILFGYLIETSEVMNVETFEWALIIVFAIFTLRAIQLKISRLPLLPLLFVAPRGLITILLFLSIDATQAISLVNKSLVIQVVLLTAVFMMIGLLSTKTQKQQLPDNSATENL